MKAERAFPMRLIWLLIVLVSALVACAGLVAREVFEDRPVLFDRWVLRAMRDTINPSKPIGPEWLADAARDVTALGSTVVLGLILFSVAGYLFASGRRHTGWLILVTVLGGTVLNSLVKLAFARPRPDLIFALTQEVSAGFPSGHSAISASCYLTLGALVAQTHTDTAIRIFVMTVAVLLTFVIGISRIYLGVHFPTDVLGGWCFGGAWALCCWMVMKQLQHSGQIERPAR
jgi:undecaprenyl-diphosphatase